MERACCGLQASPLSCFMQSRSAGCGRNAQAHSVPLSKAFLEDKLATPALLRLILTKHRPPRGEERLRVAEDAAPGPAGGLAGWRGSAPRALARPCGAAGGVRRSPAQTAPRYGQPQGGSGSSRTPRAPGVLAMDTHTHTHTRRQMCAGCPARAAAPREGPGPAPHLPFERVVPAAVPSPLGPAGPALLGAHPLGVPGGSGARLGRPQHGNSQGDPQQPPPPHRVPRAPGLRAAAASSPPPKTAGPRRPVSDQPLQGELRGEK